MEAVQSSEAQPCNKKNRISWYYRILPERLKKTGTQIKGSKISNLWQNAVNQSKKEQHNNTTVLPKHPRDQEEQQAEI